ncbi:hypothetical protein [Streptomyces venezuelae]|uniref:hypothetical protein n=1 Tax=Streptomyces venezuelae TaxID=54571 RepID=UPI003657563D
MLADGPPPLTPDEAVRDRYALTCFMDDLADSAPDQRYEQLALADLALGLYGGPLREGYAQRWRP